MKDRYEELSIWREKQKEEREFYETKFKEAKQCLLAKCVENEQLQQQLQSLKEREEGAEMVNKRKMNSHTLTLNVRIWVTWVRSGVVLLAFSFFILML